MTHLLWHVLPCWVTCVPSLRRPELVPDYAGRLAAALGLPFVACVKKIRQNHEQKTMRNSFQQVRNLDGVHAVDPGDIPAGPCLLVDDMVDSRWTFTVVAALLRRGGFPTSHTSAI